MFKMCLLAVIFLAFSQEVTSTIITEKIYLGQAVNSTSFCVYTEDFQLSESNKLTLCVKKKTLWAVCRDKVTNLLYKLGLFKIGLNRFKLSLRGKSNTCTHFSAP